MSDVKRYEPNWDVLSPADDSMVLASDGQYVQASDYDDLKKDLDEVVKALQDCVQVMQNDLNGLALIQPELKQAQRALSRI